VTTFATMTTLATATTLATVTTSHGERIDRPTTFAAAIISLRPPGRGDHLGTVTASAP
jgi:hypothetical protein